MTPGREHRRTRLPHRHTLTGLDDPDQRRLTEIPSPIGSARATEMPGRRFMGAPDVKHQRRDARPKTHEKTVPTPGDSPDPRQSRPRVIQEPEIIEPDFGH